MTADISFEQEIRTYLQQVGRPFTDETRAFCELDFTLLLPAGVRFHLEAKEKRQPYNANAWPAFAPEEELFILDDLTVRKCLAFAPRAGVVVKDGVVGRYLFFSVIDLALMPRQRVNRRIERNAPDLKGKWLIDLRNGRAAPDIAGLLALVDDSLAGLHAALYETHACYGNYVGENVGEGGSTRRTGYWEKDVRNAR
jgi:hypothetical protein